EAAAGAARAKTLTRPEPPSHAAGHSEAAEAREPVEPEQVEPKGIGQQARRFRPHADDCGSNAVSGERASVVLPVL
ncbi:MAG TPA: hypothetical protein DFS52_02120, partial [Myxococcales bacterium]|nr:hypothetical protein [Myxococcales bacterium]